MCCKRIKIHILPVWKVLLSVEDGEKDVGHSGERNSALDPAPLAAAQVEQVQSAAAASNCKNHQKIVLSPSMCALIKFVNLYFLTTFAPRRTYYFALHPCCTRL